MKDFKPIDRSTKDPNTLAARSIILPIAFCMVCGVLLIAFGTLALRITAFVLAGIMIVWGIWSVISYFRSTPIRRITESMLAIGLALLVSGTLLAFNTDYLDNMLPFIWGLALLFGGFLKIQYAFDEKTVNVSKWWIMLVLAAFSLIIGILSLLNPEFLGKSRNLVIGIFLVAEAVLDITVFFLLKHALKKFLEELPAPPQPAQNDNPEAIPAEAKAEVQAAAVPEVPAASKPEVPAAAANEAENPPVSGTEN